jgi:hypothetical protein
VPVGLGIQAAVLIVIHRVIAPRWPHAAELLLYGLSAFHTVGATHQAAGARRATRGQAP